MERKNKKKKSTLLLVAEIIMVILTAVYSVGMVCLAGAGLIYNGESYGKRLIFVGIFLIVSGIFMTSGAILALLNKRIFLKFSAILTIIGLTICIIMLYILCTHADHAGWTDSYTMTAVSTMYKSRILPVIVPVIMVMGIDLFKLI